MRIFIILTTLCYLVQAQLLVLNKSPLGGLTKAAGSAAKVVPGSEVLSSLVEGQWKEFLKGKNYSPTELLTRKNIFVQNTERITKFAQQAGTGAISFALKMNPLGDLTFLEFNKLFNGLKGALIGAGKSKAVPYQPEKEEAIPESIDWRERGAVTPIKNQQKCAGCWAFSAAGALEGQRFKKSGKLEEVSIQNLLDCSKGNAYGGNDGCQGGLVETAFDYVQDNGANSGSEYSYEAKDGSCRFKKENVVANCTGYIRVPRGDEKALAEALATHGPISIAIHVVETFQFYSNGVYHDPKCGNKEDDLNHAVLLVGYGKEPSGQKYWLVKNSYGTEWGIDGYIKIARDAGNHCGIATYARYPIV